MTNFENLYQILLTDPNFGKLGSRKEQFRLMYVEGMKRAQDIVNTAPDFENIEFRIEKAISGESKNRMNYDCYDTEIISKGHKARKASESKESRKKARESLINRYKVKIGNARKYEWEKLIKDGVIFIPTYATKESVRSCAAVFVKRKGINSILLSKYTDVNGLRGVTITMKRHD